MMFLRLLCCKGEECILRHTVGAIYTTNMQFAKVSYSPMPSCAYRVKAMAGEVRTAGFADSVLAGDWRP
jgi:hypothetical protein